MADQIRLKVADISSPQVMGMGVRLEVPGSTDVVDLPFRIYTGFLNVTFPKAGFAGGDRYISAEVISYLPQSDRTVRNLIDVPGFPTELMASCSVADFRICKAKDGDEFGAVSIDECSAALKTQDSLEGDPLAAVLKVKVSARGGNIFSIGYTVFMKGGGVPRLNPFFDPKDALPDF
ncbi:hypothetical protein ACWDFL_35175 [Streptomyces bungoensis]